MDDNPTQQDDEFNKNYHIYDVLAIIMRSVSNSTLRNCAQVCRSWHEAARIEIWKRQPGPLHQVLLPALHETDNPAVDLSEWFTAKPNTVLMFCGIPAPARAFSNVEFKVLRSYLKKLPRVIVVGVDYAFMDLEPIPTCTYSTIFGIRQPPPFHDILGISFPESLDFTVKIVECVSHEKNVLGKANKIFRRLHDEPELLDNAIFILFSRSNYSIGSHVMKLFSKRYANVKVNLWGGTIADVIKRSDDGFPDYQGTHGFLGMLIHCPRLHAHCFVFQMDDEHKVLLNLTMFRTSFQLRRNNVGLVCGPKNPFGKPENFSSWQKKPYAANEFIRLIKKIFPEVQFTSMFNDTKFTYYGANHLNKDQGLEHKNAMSIMIMCYD